MIYTRKNLDALRTAADAANRYTPFETGNVEFRYASEALLMHVYTAIRYLAATVDEHSTDELRVHLLKLMRAGHTQATIAKASKVSASTISRIINNPDARHAPQIAEQLLAVPIAKPVPTPLDPQILAILDRGERATVPHGQKDRYAEHLAASGADTKHIASVLRMSYNRATKAQKAAA